MTDLPAALREACINGDLPKAKSLYHEFIRDNPTAQEMALSQISLLAARHTHPDILDFCFSEGFKINPDHVNDPLLDTACDVESIVVFETLFNHGIDVNRYLEINGSFLTSACYHGNAALVKHLLDHGADPNIGYPLGHYEALVWAIVGSQASIEIVILLLSHGTIVKGSGALTAAAEKGNLEALRLLLDKESKEEEGHDIEEIENYGEEDPRILDDQGTPLYKAAANGHLSVVDFLINEGASTGFSDRKGRSVLDKAVENGHRDVADRIRKSIS